jgi:hypothetical protein
MSVSRATILRSSAKFTFGGGIFYPESAIDIDYAPEFENVMAWAYGRVDEAKKDFKIPLRARLWSAVENLAILFPPAVLTPVPGTSLVSDAELIVHAKNTDRVTFHNMFISRLANLYLGIDKNFFAADVEFMAIIKSGKNPDESGAYFTRDTAAFTGDTFAKTNFQRTRWTAAWADRTGMTGFEFREGINVGWNLDVQYDYSANYGTDNAYIGENGLIGEVRGIPALALTDIVGNTHAKTGLHLGSLASSVSGDLTLATGVGTSHTIVLNNAFMAQHSESFDIKKLRAQEILLRTTTGFALGVQAATGSVA